MSYCKARHEVLAVTDCELPYFLYEHANKHLSDPEIRWNFMLNAAISYASGDVENVYEDEVDAYLEKVSADWEDA